MGGSHGDRGLQGKVKDTVMLAASLGEQYALCSSPGEPPVPPAWLSERAPNPFFFPFSGYPPQVLEMGNTSSIPRDFPLSCLFQNWGTLKVDSLRNKKLIIIIVL